MWGPPRWDDRVQHDSGGVRFDIQPPKEERHLWTLTVFGYHNLQRGAPGRSKRRVPGLRRHWRLRGLGARCHGMGIAIMASSPLVRSFWRVLDSLDYLRVRFIGRVRFIMSKELRHTRRASSAKAQAMRHVPSAN
jgi:hypothetical protein